MMALPMTRRPAAAGDYDPAGLHVLSYARGFTLWHYRTAAALETVAEAGYFNPACHLLRPGDRIAVNVHEAGRFRAARDFCVIAAARGEVRLVPLSAAAAV